MKSFLKFLKEEEKKLRKASQKSDVRAEAQHRVDYTIRNTNQPQETPPFEKVASQYLNVNSQLNPYNSSWVTDMYMAKNMSEPSMAAHKAWQTDVGMAFDQDPMTKELIASPEGFKAVHKRTKENRNVKFTPLTINQYRSDIWRGIFGGNQ